ncbi:MAG: hypothetical protein KA369_14850 [Spirochaetes bacterium]|nr:hypothetical protein [Spirochaetota bacterium]
MMITGIMPIGLEKYESYNLVKDIYITTERSPGSWIKTFNMPKKYFIFFIHKRINLYDISKDVTMIIETTININRANLDKLLYASIRTGHSIRDIVSVLLKRMSNDHDRMVVSWERVRYQKHDNNAVWKCFHLMLWPDEYEFFLDLRKVCKQSVSRLIAYAIDKYLDEVISGLIKVPDNNRYKNYTIIRRLFDGVVCWMYYWGLPQTLPENP